MKCVDDKYKGRSVIGRYGYEDGSPTAPKEEKVDPTEAETAEKVKCELKTAGPDVPKEKRVDPTEAETAEKVKCELETAGPTVPKEEKVDPTEAETVEKVKRELGVAFDIGTTTIAGALCDMRTGEHLAICTAENPQRRYGPDVISRISCCMKNEQNLGKLRCKTTDCMNEMIRELLSKVASGEEKIGKALCVEEETGSVVSGGSEDISTMFNGNGSGKVCVDRSEIRKAVVCGNTTMSHIFAGQSVDGLAQAPFTPAYNGVVHLKAGEAGLDMGKEGLRIGEIYRSEPATDGDAEVIVVPNIAGHVGGDITAGIVATGILEMDGLVLLVDVGTNGEIVLIDGDKAYACSAAAGPAFEGTSIKWGMRAAEGAIEAVSIEDDIVRVKTIGSGESRGVDGVELMAEPQDTEAFGLGVELQGVGVAGLMADSRSFGRERQMDESRSIGCDGLATEPRGKNSAGMTAEPCGICGSGIISAVAAMLDAGIVDETGRLVPTGHEAARAKSRTGIASRKLEMTLASRETGAGNISRKSETTLASRATGAGNISRKLEMTLASGTTRAGNASGKSATILAHATTETEDVSATTETSGAFEISEKEGVREFILAERSDGRHITITQKDIREVQLAKGAIRAGIEILLEKVEKSPEDIDRIILSGAFGSHIDTSSAARIGLLPDIDSDRITSAGNTALKGASMILTNEGCLKLAGKIPDLVKHVELATEPDFQEMFIEAMGF